jgi:hypothetical protein
MVVLKMQDCVEPMNGSWADMPEIRFETRKKLTLDVKLALREFLEEEFERRERMLLKNPHGLA